MLSKDLSAKSAGILICFSVTIRVSFDVYDCLIKYLQYKNQLFSYTFKLSDTIHNKFQIKTSNFRFPVNPVYLLLMLSQAHAQFFSCQTEFTINIITEFRTARRLIHTPDKMVLSKLLSYTSLGQ